MSIVLIAACLLGIGDPPADEGRARELVRQLGSGVYAEREEADKALKEIGPAALPSLREAARSGDLELRTRAEGLIRAIAASDVTAPTLVPLDFRDRPLEEVLKAIGDQGRVNLEPGPGLDRRQKVTLTSPEPLPFWRAYDRLCRELSLVEGMSQPQRPAFPNQEAGAATPTLALREGYHRPERLRYHGQIRIRRLEPGDGRGIVMARNGVPARALFLEFRAEPGRMLIAAEPLKVLEAIDARGRNLVVHEDPRRNIAFGNVRVVPPPGAFEKMAVIPPPGIPQAGAAPMNPTFEQITLSPPGDNPNIAQNFQGDPEGGRIPIKRLRVGVKFLLVAPAAEPKTIPIADALDRIVGNGLVNLRVNSILTDPFDQETTIKLSLLPGSDQVVGNFIPFAPAEAGPAAQARARREQIRTMQLMQANMRMLNLNLGFDFQPLEFLGANGQPIMATSTQSVVQNDRRSDRWQFPSKPESIRIPDLKVHAESFEVEFADFDL